MVRAHCSGTLVGNLYRGSFFFFLDFLTHPVFAITGQTWLHRVDRREFGWPKLLPIAIVRFTPTNLDTMTQTQTTKMRKFLLNATSCFRLPLFFFTLIYFMSSLLKKSLTDLRFAESNVTTFNTKRARTRKTYQFRDRFLKTLKTHRS